VPLYVGGSSGPTLFDTDDGVGGLSETSVVGVTYPESLVVGVSPSVIVASSGASGK
jgi:hypothetical protein